MSDSTKKQIDSMENHIATSAFNDLGTTDISAPSQISNANQMALKGLTQAPKIGRAVAALNRHQDLIKNATAVVDIPRATAIADSMAALNRHRDLIKNATAVVDIPRATAIADSMAALNRHQDLIKNINTITRSPRTQTTIADKRDNTALSHTILNAPSGPIPPTHLSATERLGKMVREKRKELKLSQQEFADMSGVGRRFISELERGKPTLEFGLVLQVCEAAGIDIMAKPK